MRGPEPDTSFPLLAHPAIAIAQISDGPKTIDPDKIEHEAGIERLLPGQGMFDISAFLNALNPSTPISVEIPQQNNINASQPPQLRANNAVKAAKTAMGW